VTLFTLHVFWEFNSEIVGRVMDGVDAENIEAARRAADTVRGVEDTTVRGRWMGRSLTLEVEGMTAAGDNMAEAEKTGQAMIAAGREAVEDVCHLRWLPCR
jgi:divalent metal cation (Fe/Co/Zn/Cd) transporter